MGQQMAAMSAIFVNMLALQPVGAPVTNSTGGTSIGNSNAGSQSNSNPQALKPATGGDKAGAGFVTALVLVSATGMFGWMSI